MMNHTAGAKIRIRIEFYLPGMAAGRSRKGCEQSLLEYAAGAVVRAGDCRGARHREICVADEAK